MDGCSWKTISDKVVGVEMFAQDCDFGFRKIRFEPSPKDASIYSVMIDTAPGSKESREALIVVFKKPAGEAIEASIRRVASPKAPAARRPRCKVLPAKDAGLPKGHLAYAYAPDDEEKLVAEAHGDIPELPCGEYGLDFDSQSYFEYHPSESKTRFAMVFIGQDEPLFDEKTLKFLP